MLISDRKYRLAPGTQVRQEDSGLLFYTMRGPRLYFLPVKTVFGPDFFNGECPLLKYLENKEKNDLVSESVLKNVEKNLDQLIDKGVLLEC